MDEHTYYVYIMSSKTRTIYTGVTSNLEGRVLEHKLGKIPGFTKKYQITKLVYYEEYADAYDASAREKQIKGYRRSRKVEPIKSLNSKWFDFAEGWIKKHAESQI